jgi:hypothetical protein
MQADSSTEPVNLTVKIGQAGFDLPVIIVGSVLAVNYPP